MGPASSFVPTVFVSFSPEKHFLQSVISRLRVFAVYLQSLMLNFSIAAALDASHDSRSNNTFGLRNRALEATD
ncbi:Hypothetical predicted protein, partial [Olea europaea subsp. europaea]